MPSHTAWLISRILNAVFADRAFCTFKIGYLERIHSLKCSRFAGARCETAKLLSHSNYVPPTNNQYCCFFMSRTHKNPFPVRGSASTPVAYFSWQPRSVWNLITMLWNLWDSNKKFQRENNHFQCSSFTGVNIVLSPWASPFPAFLWFQNPLRGPAVSQIVY